MMNEIELLKEINKNCQTGIEGLEYTMDKVKDSNLKHVLMGEIDSYNNIKGGN